MHVFGLLTPAASLGGALPGWRPDVVRAALCPDELGRARGETQSWRWSVSYVGAIIDRGLIKLIIAPQHKRVPTVQFNESVLRSLLVRQVWQNLARG